MKSKACGVKRDVKVIVKKKAKKFQDSKGSQIGDGSTGPHKAEGIWVSPRDSNFSSRYKPIWQEWGKK